VEGQSQARTSDLSGGRVEDHRASEEASKDRSRRERVRTAACRGKNHVWNYDFVFDQLDSGRALKILPIVDNFTRECLVIEVAHNITAARVIEILEHLVAKHGAPQFMRSDNGPEFIARAVREWLEAKGIGTAFIEPGSPWENGYSESFNSRFRDEVLDREVFTSLLEARTLIEQHRRHYNDKRPHSSLGYTTPTKFARQHQAMEAAGAWKAAEKRAFPHSLDTAPHPPPAFPTSPTASAAATQTGVDPDSWTPEDRGGPRCQEATNHTRKSSRGDW
jgi:putative transposase